MDSDLIRYMQVYFKEKNGAMKKNTEHKNFGIMVQLLKIDKLEYQKKLSIV